MNKPVTNNPAWVKEWTPPEAIKFWLRARKNDPSDTKGLGEMYKRLLSHDEMKAAWEAIQTKCGPDFKLFVGYLCLKCEAGFLGPQTTTEKFSNERQRNKHKDEVAALARDLANKIRGSALDRAMSYVDADDVCRRGRAPITQDVLSGIYANRITPAQLLDEIANHYGGIADEFDVRALHSNKLTVRRQYFVRSLMDAIETFFDDTTGFDDVLVEFTITALDDVDFTKTTMKNWKNE